MILFLFQVNGTRVTHCTHVDVVNLIKCKLVCIDFCEEESVEICQIESIGMVLVKVFSFSFSSLFYFERKNKHRLKRRRVNV